jgi:type 1 glutamine amidotransferase
VDGALEFPSADQRGHQFSSLSSPHVRAIVLRAIAWAGKRDVDSLATPEEVAALR